METFVKFNNFRNLQKFLKGLRNDGYKKEIFEIHKEISIFYKTPTYHLHIKYKKGNKYWEIKKELFPNNELQGFWALKYFNNKLIEKVYIKEYEFKDTY